MARSSREHRDQLLEDQHNMFLDQLDHSSLPLYMADMYGCYPSFDYPLEVEENKTPASPDIPRSTRWNRGYNQARNLITNGSDPQSLYNESFGALEHDDFDKGWQRACTEAGAKCPYEEDLPF